MNTSRTEHELVAQSKNGDHAAFTELIRRSSPIALRAIRRVTYNHADAEDILQETLLKAFSKLASFNEQSAFSTWLTRIAINSSFMVLRRMKHQREVSLSTESGEDANFFACPPVANWEDHGIGREAIGNAFKHSNGSTIQVEIGYEPSELQLRIRDDGVGMDPDLLSGGRLGHWGIHNMKERAEKIGARLTISSEPKVGTSLELRLPVRSVHGVRVPSRH